MRLKTYSIIGIFIALIIIGFYLYPKPFVTNESFESGLGEWSKDAHVPLDPNNPGHYVFWNISRTNSLAYSGSYSLNFSIDGRQDDGTIWIERRIPVKPYSNIQVKVSFHLYSESENQVNIIAGVVVFVGTYDPEVEDNFQSLGQANQVSGWKEYNYIASLNTSSSDEVWVAVGITVLWETYMNYYIDSVTIHIIYE
ncbi:MAG: hypothetical protein H3Z53_11840 [archaeon]|nr:hypothetical protein [archaeon]MCP8315038.1 hypothetical protein [archaeon]